MKAFSLSLAYINLEIKSGSFISVGIISEGKIAGVPLLFHIYCPTAIAAFSYSLLDLINKPFLLSNSCVISMLSILALSPILCSSMIPDNLISAKRKRSFEIEYFIKAPDHSQYFSELFRNNSFLFSIIAASAILGNCSALRIAARFLSIIIFLHIGNEIPIEDSPFKLVILS